MAFSLKFLAARCARFSLLTICGISLLIAIHASAQGQSGGGTDLIGTGGRHTIRGRIYFPSGRRTDIRLKIKLENMISGDLSVLADSNGSFSFRGLNAGSYTVVVDGGDDYETAREPVYIDTDGSNARRGVSLPPVSRLYSVDISLRPKRTVGPKPGVLNAALANIPESARERYESAGLAAQKGDHKKAIEHLNEALSVHANFPLALNALGEQYLKLNKPEKAAEAFASALTLTPEDFTARLNYGVALTQSNRLSEGETQLRRALKKNDNSWPGHMYLGITLLRMRRIDEAETELRRSLAIAGKDLALPHFYLGGIYWARNDFKRAADELDLYLKLAPGAPDAERTRTTIKDLRQKK